MDVYSQELIEKSHVEFIMEVWVAHYTLKKPCTGFVKTQWIITYGI